MSLLTLANLHYSFDERPLIEGVNITLDQRQRVGMVGRNGCGKSTLMKIIAGLEGLKPDSGQVQLARGGACRLFGSNAEPGSPAYFARGGGGDL